MIHDDTCLQPSLNHAKNVSFADYLSYKKKKRTKQVIPSHRTCETYSHVARFLQIHRKIHV